MPRPSLTPGPWALRGTLCTPPHRGTLCTPFKLTIMKSRVWEWVESREILPPLLKFAHTHSCVRREGPSILHFRRVACGERDHRFCTSYEPRARRSGQRVRRTLSGKRVRFKHRVMRSTSVGCVILWLHSWSSLQLAVRVCRNLVAEEAQTDRRAQAALQVECHPFVRR